MLCPNCDQEMQPVELHKVPVDNLKEFLSVEGNKLNDNWYWCPFCDSYDQDETPRILTPDEERLAKLIECYPSFF